MLASLKHPRIALERIETYKSDTYWTDLNFRAKVFGEKHPLQSIEILSWPDVTERPLVHEITSCEFMPTSVGQVLGPSWSTHWFRVTFNIPESWLGKSVAFVWDSNCEALLYENGQPQQAFTGGGGADRRALYIICKEAKREHVTGTYQYLVEVACNGMFGNGVGGMIQPPGDRSFVLQTAELVVIDQQAWSLLWDYIVISNMAKDLPSDSPRAAEALTVANDMINAYYPDDSKTWEQASELARKFFGKKNGDGQHEVFAVGHCHIDTAWLWPYSETRRKVARSWSTVLKLMTQYDRDGIPHPFTFVASQSVQMKWLKEDHPHLFAQVQAAAKRGRFVPVGGTFVEPDANIPSGESLIRQFLFGQQFMEAEFGQICEEFWLPDTFGYSAQLPQIMRKCGVKYFLSQKLSWNLVTKFPHTSFVWQGLDGSQVLAHFPPAETYNSSASTADILKSSNNCKDKHFCNASMLLFGHGDGGGGPAPEHLEQLLRTKDLDGIPKVILDSSPSSFFKRLETDFKQARRPTPLWRGELYLELHQGTLTSQALVKKRNRQCEVLLRDVELLLCLCRGLEVGFERVRSTCTKAMVQEFWEGVLLNQFHDVIPGSSIAMVYKDAHDLYEGILEEGKLVREFCMQVLGQDLNLSPGLKMREDAEVLPVGTVSALKGMYVANTCGFERRGELLRVPKEYFSLVKLEAVHSSTVIQTIRNEDVLIPVDIDKVGRPTFNVEVAKGELPAVQVVQHGDKFILENNYVRVEIERSGLVTSFIDNRVKPAREVVKRLAAPTMLPSTSACNMLMLYENIPFYWDAWDLMPYHVEKGSHVNGHALKAENITSCIVEHGPFRASIRISFPIGQTNSNISMLIHLTAFSPLLSFEVDVEWHENRKILKVEFPVSVSSDFATYDVQFGAVQRPTHSNTAYDAARYEVCGHKFTDLSEAGYGVAILNDCKYGHSCKDSTVCLSLLRAPKAPDADCDMGKHSFRYAMFPHLGMGLLDTGVIETSIAFNSPLVVCTYGPTPPAPSADAFSQLTPLRGIYVEYLPPHTCVAILDTVKLSEASDDVLILRLYEAAGGRGVVRISLPFKVEQACVCDMLERPMLSGLEPEELLCEFVQENEASQSTGGHLCSVHVYMLPFEVKSIRLELTPLCSLGHSTDKRILETEEQNGSIKRLKTDVEFTLEPALGKEPKQGGDNGFISHVEMSEGFEQEQVVVVAVEQENETATILGTVEEANQDLDTFHEDQLVAAAELQMDVEVTDRSEVLEFEEEPGGEAVHQD